MSHDLEDLLELIKELEKRIIELEIKSLKIHIQSDDDWYWEHG